LKNAQNKEKQHQNKQKGKQQKGYFDGKA